MTVTSSLGKKSNVMEVKKGRTAKSPIVKTATEFCEVSTTHGLYYIFERKFGQLSQLFWIVTCVTLFSISMFLISSAVRNYHETPTITSVFSTGHPVRKMDFPSITMCGLGMVEDILNAAIWVQAEIFIAEQRGTDRYSFNYSLETESLKDLFAQNNVDYQLFIDEMYPGLPYGTDLSELFPMLVAPNPDAILTSSYAIEGPYDRCEDQVGVSGEDPPPCDDDTFALDANYEVCYKVLDKTKDHYDGEACIDSEAFLFDVWDDEQLATLAKLIANATGKT